MLVRDVRGVAQGAAVPMKQRVTSLAVKTPYMAQGMGKPTAPVAREAAKVARELSPEERLQERLEERRLAAGWRERKVPSKGYGGA